jgi:hypothetical protein
MDRYWPYMQWNLSHSSTSDSDSGQAIRPRTPHGSGAAAAAAAAARMRTRPRVPSRSGSGGFAPLPFSVGALVPAETMPGAGAAADELHAEHEALLERRQLRRRFSSHSSRDSGIAAGR